MQYAFILFSHSALVLSKLCRIFGLEEEEEQKDHGDTLCGACSENYTANL